MIIKRLKKIRKYDEKENDIMYGYGRSHRRKDRKRQNTSFQIYYYSMTERKETSPMNWGIFKYFRAYCLIFYNNSSTI